MKIFKIIVSIFIVVITLGNIYAYSTDSYSIEVPNTYIMQSTSESANPIIFSKNTEIKQPNFNVYVNDNTSKSDISVATDEDISTLANEISNQIYSAYKINVNVLKKEKTVLNGYDAIFISLKWDSEDTLGYTIYQNQYSMMSKNYIYTLTFSSNKAEDLTSLETQNIKDSFVIKDELNKSNFFDFKQLFIYAIAGAVIGLIYGVIKKKKEV